MCSSKKLLEKLQENNNRNTPAIVGGYLPVVHYTDAIQEINHMPYRTR